MHSKVTKLLNSNHLRYYTIRAIILYLMIYFLPARVLLLESFPLTKGKDR